jgi:hypothetical protein
MRPSRGGGARGRKLPAGLVVRRRRAIEQGADAAREHAVDGGQRDRGAVRPPGAAARRRRRVPLPARGRRRGSAMAPRARPCGSSERSEAALSPASVAQGLRVKDRPGSPRSTTSRSRPARAWIEQARRSRSPRPRPIRARCGDGGFDAEHRRLEPASDTACRAWAHADAVRRRQRGQRRRLPARRLDQRGRQRSAGARSARPARSSQPRAVSTSRPMSKERSSGRHEAWPSLRAQFMLVSKRGAKPSGCRTRPGASRDGHQLRIRDQHDGARCMRGRSSAADDPAPDPATGSKAGPDRWSCAIPSIASHPPARSRCGTLVSVTMT